MNRIEVPSAVISDVQQVVQGVIRDRELYPGSAEYSKRYLNYAALGEGVVLDVFVVIRLADDKDVEDRKEIDSLFLSKS